MADYAHQTSPQQKRGLQKQAGHACKTTGAKNKLGDYLVLGRFVEGRRIWSVYLYHAVGKAPKLIGRDFDTEDEAFIFVDDRKKGQIAVGWPGMRGRFKQAGSLLLPSSDITVPGEDSGMKVRVIEEGAAYVI